MQTKIEDKHDESMICFLESRACLHCQSRFLQKWYINGTSSLINTSSFINILIELKLLVLIELITHLLIHLLT